MCKVDVNQKTNKRTAYCCNMIEVNGVMVKHGVAIPKGKGIFFQKSETDYGFYCEECFADRYHVKYLHNDKMAKKQDSNEEKKHYKHGFLMGLEVESNVWDETYMGILRRSHFVKSYDSSVCNEYISPILQGLNGVPKMLNSIIKFGFKQDRHCGAHVNLSNEIYSLKPYANTIIDNYEIIFRELYRSMRYYPSVMEECFGRALSYYCEDFSTTSHYSFINVEKLRQHGVLEFRFPKIVTSSQYIDTIKFCRELFMIIYSGMINGTSNEFIAFELNDLFMSRVYEIGNRL